jgi:DNA-binding NarL/FixJ family response regulator
MSPRAARGQSGGMQKIYLVEDSPALRDRLLALLGAIPNACMVGHASTVNSAITDIAASPPDVVLLDVGLPDGSGFEVLRELRGRVPQTDFYMLSNHATEPYRKLAQQLGALGFYDKSTEFNQVRDLIVQRSAVK